MTNYNILINSHSNLNNISGDTIWLSNLSNTLCHTIDNYITIITNYNLVNNFFLKNIEYKIKIKIIYTPDIIKYIDDNNNNFNEIIIRNHNILSYFKHKTWLKKTILYGLNEHINDIKLLNNNYKEIWTQSEIIKKKYIDNGICNSKIIITPPIAYKYNFNIPKRNDNEIRLIYCGTLRIEENILEIINEFKILHNINPNIKLKIIYGKIADFGNLFFLNKINDFINKGIKGITFKSKLSHREACYEIAISDIGICWRKNGWGDNGEISTKIKEYELYNLEICYNLRKYRINKFSVI